MIDKLNIQRMLKLKEKLIITNRYWSKLQQIIGVNNIDNIQAHSSILSPFKEDISREKQSELIIAAHNTTGTVVHCCTSTMRKRQ